MPTSTTDVDPIAQASEFFRLSLTKLSQAKISFTPVNYALVYFYVAGNDLALNKRLDELFEDIDQWTDETANKLYNRYICHCDDKANEGLREELLMIMAQILGSLIDIAGKTAVSNELLENHMTRLASSNEPKTILNIAVDIIAETRHFVDQTRDFEINLRESSQEISFLKDELDHARKQATMDALTGLHNRGGFDDAIVDSIEMSLSNGFNFCLLFFDIDHFKNVNDTHGHLVGDKVLIGLSKLLKKHMRGNDYLARYGGEEFAIILRDTPITGAFSVAENLRKSIEKLRLKHVKTGQQIGQITISIGVASYRRGEAVEDLIHRCDKALYRAKSLGRNRTVLAD